MIIIWAYPRRYAVSSSAEWRCCYRCRMQTYSHVQIPPHGVPSQLRSGDVLHLVATWVLRNGGTLQPLPRTQLLRRYSATRCNVSGVTLLEGARGKGWLGAPLIRSACAKCKTSKRALAAWGPGTRLRAPVGSRGRSPRKLLCISMWIQHFQRKLRAYIR